TGMPKSRVDKFNNILDIVRDLQKQFDEVEISQVVEEARKYDIDEVSARRFIEDLLRKGELFEPHHGHIKIVRKFE
ncbi:MAG: hypothetical protein AB1468_02530, partial [Candidatus Micrarchaeota archaeon]